MSYNNKKEVIPIRSIFIDAGHGGTDPGAVGRVLGVREKDVVLSIALRLGGIVANGGFRALQSRTTDVRLNFTQRTQMAVRDGSLAYLSLHCNSFTNNTANGTEVFFRQGDANSALLAKFIQEEIVKTTGWRDRGIKPNKTFGVLRSSTPIPAVLVEYNFLSHPVHEAELANDNTQIRLANATYVGIIRYLKERGFI